MWGGPDDGMVDILAIVTVLHRRHSSTKRQATHSAGGTSRWQLPAGMSIRHHVDLADFQDGQEEGGLVGQSVGRQHHLVLVELASEVLHTLNAARMSQMCPRVDHA